MKVLIYNNKEKDFSGEILLKLITELDKNEIKYEILEDNNLEESVSADVLFAIGGDGTILYLSEFCNKNSIPLIGINAGRLGFLCEFEKNEIENAVVLLKSGRLVEDNCLMMKVQYKGKEYYALNDVFVQRTYNQSTYKESVGNMATDLRIEINDMQVLKMKGDGAIISTPTGSTAYSLSLGGPIIYPGSNSFVLSTIAAHSFNQRPIVYNSESYCRVFVDGKANVGAFVDGEMIGLLKENDYIEIQKADKPLIFLRKKNYDFMKRLSNKLGNSFGGNWWVEKQDLMKY